MELSEVVVYQLAKALSRKVWEMYSVMDWQEKKIMGDQWIRSVDSIGANIAEGYGRFHYLDRNRFHYNARGSLIEARHWTDLLLERKTINETAGREIMIKLVELNIKLNNYIQSVIEKSKQ